MARSMHAQRRGTGASLMALVLVTLLMALVAAPNKAWARDYSITSVEIDAEVGTDGALTVREAREFDFDGSFHGVYWKIPTGTYAGRRIETSILAVGEIVDGQFVQFEQSSSGAEHTYELTEYSSYVLVKLYSSHEDERAIFGISYRDTNLAVRYEDTSELYWKFVSDGWDVESENVTCTVSLPMPDGTTVVPGDNVRAWGHGPLDAEVSFSGDQVVYRVPGVGSSEFAEARITFPAEWLSDASVQSGTRLPTILAEEEEWADQANAQRARARLLMGAALGVGGIVPLASLAWTLVSRARYKSSHKALFDDKYFRDVPSDDHPAVLGALLNDGEATDEGITAALMRLTDQGYATLELVKSTKKGLFGREKVEEDFRLSPVRFIQREDYEPNARQIDRVTMRFVFQQLAPLASPITGDKDNLYFSSLERAAKRNPETYENYYKGWKGSVKSACAKRGFFDDTRSTGRTGAIVAGVVDIVVAMASIFALLAFDAPWYLIVGAGLLGGLCGAACLIIASTMDSLSQEALELIAKLKALRNWLKDFTRLDEAVPQDVVLWNRLLVMAVVLGVSDEVIEQLKVAAPRLLEDDRMYTTYYWCRGYGSYGSPSRGFSDAMSTAHSVSTAAKASSSMSSGSGGGGGFSGGGGGGFGGGGGGGAF